MTAADGISQNPEPVINAVIAALEAQRSALLTNWLLVLVIIVAAMLAVGIVAVLFKVNAIQEHTNGIMAKLIEATRLLGIEEGAESERKKRDSEQTKV